MDTTAIEPHCCGSCGAATWTAPARAADGRAVIAVALHLTPDGTLCGRGAFAVDEPDATPERQRRWCAETASSLLAQVSDGLVAMLALVDGLLVAPPAAALELIAEAHADVERRIEARDGVDEGRRRVARRIEDVCISLAAAGLTWAEVDPAGRFRARVEAKRRKALTRRATARRGRRGKRS
ncbi:MAG: hypothetical protein U0324_29360 [Polyangiales bacterium]